MRYLSVLFALFFVCACQPTEQQALYRYHQIEHAVWESGDAITFELDSLPVNPKKSYDISLEIVHNNRYRYNDLWLATEFVNLTDSLHTRQTMHIRLADSLEQWRGSGVGGLRQLSVSYLNNRFLDSTKSYRISVRQMMRDNSLKGIEKIGVKIN